MHHRLLGLLACTLTLMSCTITTYSDFPMVDLQSEPLPKKDFPIYYHVVHLSQFDRQTKRNYPLYKLEPRYATWAGYDELERIFEESRIFSKTIASDTVPEKGIYCAVAAAAKPASGLAHFFHGFAEPWLPPSQMLPYYSGEAGYVVEYELYVDKELKKTYQYEITKKGVAWILLLPFAWINFFTYSEEDAFRATAYQFFLDAERDGYLQ